MAQQWDIIERRDRWEVRRGGVLQKSADVERAWQYVAERAQDDDVVQVRYYTGRTGQPLTGVSLRALLAAPPSDPA